MNEGWTSSTSRTITARATTIGAKSVCVALCLFFAACAPRIPEGTFPPARAFYFPSHVAVAPAAPASRPLLYVVSSNFDQRYSVGWVSTIDFAELVARLRAADEPEAAIGASALWVPSLAGRLTINEDGTLAVLTHRGAGQLSVINIGDEGAGLRCGDPNATALLDAQQRRSDCDAEHLITLQNVDRLEEVASIQGMAAVHDPFAGVFVSDEDGEHLALGYLDLPFVSLFRRTDGPEPTLVHDLTARVSNAGGTGPWLRYPFAGQDYLVAGNQRTVSAAPFGSVFTLAWNTLEADVDATQAAAFSLGDEVGSTEISDFATTADGLVLVASQHPDLVAVLRPRIEVDADRAGNLVSTLQFDLVAAQSIPGSPYALAFIPKGTAEESGIVAVTSFAEDAVFFLSLRGTSLQWEGRLDSGEGAQRIGDGPVDIVHVSLAGDDYLVVPTFFDHGVAVIDARADDPAAFVTLGQVFDASVL